MEVTIIIPDDLFRQAEELAQQLGISRHELYTEAPRRFLKLHRDAELTRQLNELYEHEDSSLDPVVMQMQLTALEREEW